MNTRHVPPRFCEDNTEGYSHAALDELNRRFDEAIDAEHAVRWQDDDLAYKAWTDRVAERVLADFDADDALPYCKCCGEDSCQCQQFGCHSCDPMGAMMGRNV